MIQDSRVCDAWVARAISGRATFNDDIAAVTAANARQTTAVTAGCRTPAGDVVGSAGEAVWIDTGIPS